jgi:conjugal transfer pilin signal peptidase TrbI
MSGEAVEKDPVRTAQRVHPASDGKEKEKRPRSRRRNRCLVPVALTAGCLLALNAALTLFITDWRAPRVVTFDMKGTLDAFMDQSAKQTLSPEAAAALSARFSEAVSASLGAWHERHGALILVAPAVVAGAEDVTPAIQHDIADRMRKGAE